jgi:hypothetical protein
MYNATFVLRHLSFSGRSFEFTTSSSVFFSFHSVDLAFQNDGLFFGWGTQVFHFVICEVVKLTCITEQIHEAEKKKKRHQ